MRREAPKRKNMRPPGTKAARAAAAEVAGVAALGPQPADVVTTGNERVRSETETPHPKPAHGAIVGIEHARTLGDAGPDWLAKNYPHHFPDAESARAALAA